MYVLAIFYNVLGSALALLFWRNPLSWTFIGLQVALAAFSPQSKPYIIGYEPHSALPIAMPVAFNQFSQVLPKGLTKVRQLASSICFYIPIVRQLWWWLGVRPVSKENIKHLLATGHSVVLCPGGVREIFYMEKATTGSNLGPLSCRANSFTG
ncbi:hypothetical protein WJX84_011617 [Apatococcus fuscideae]|uniref:Uncharacterized protein n=1 Tax=Apatococcus fuscideae TaxID=2026836 RepID=A0AAW1SY73_9CHLO